ncbi:MAG: hypothetical protein COB60_11130 [Flavobacteriaceae bacterium]|nr:MAG: hypothetical protein COB60_11130 [Flavobacteriaceae bacterium]
MKKFALIFNLPLVLQISTNNDSSMIFDSIQYVSLIICLLTSSIVMMLIPVILCYSMVTNFLNMRDYNIRIDTETCNQQNNSKYLKSICKKYHEFTSNFYKKLFALAAWNIFSVIYIIIGFESFSKGLREYFFFPFAIFQSLGINEIFDSIYKFQSNWLFMTTITILTFYFYFFGKYFGKYKAKNMFKKRGLI